MPMIRETIVTTRNAEGKVHIAPLGLIAEEGGWIIAPFKPSTTLDNLRDNHYAVANFTDDVLVFAGCLTRLDALPQVQGFQVMTSPTQILLQLRQHEVPEVIPLGLHVAERGADEDRTGPPLGHTRLRHGTSRIAAA